MCSNVVGNAIGGLIIVEANGPWFFTIMGGIMLLAVFGFTFVIVPPHSEPELGEIKMNEGIVQ
jgi:hypothetical protein